MPMSLFLFRSSSRWCIAVFCFFWWRSLWKSLRFLLDPAKISRQDRIVLRIEIWCLLPVPQMMKELERFSLLLVLVVTAVSKT